MADSDNIHDLLTKLPFGQERINRSLEDMKTRLEAIEANQVRLEASQTSKQRSIDAASRDIELKYKAQQLAKHDPPTGRVFRTFRLLEAILLRLRPLDVIMLGRVSHTFKDTIASSSRLQRALFLQPDMNPTTDVRLNTLLLNAVFFQKYNLCLDPHTNDLVRLMYPHYGMRHLDFTNASYDY